MRKSFKLSSQWREPRVLLRGIIGALLIANVAAAVVAFKPFGGGADDLERQEAALQQQISAMRKRIAADKLMVDKMQNARQDKDQFLAKYVTDAHFAAHTLLGELERIAGESGVKQLPVTYYEQEVEGSDTFKMVTMTEGCEGSYANLAKFINLVDKSPHFFIIESLDTAAPQQNGGALNVRLKIDTFVNGSEATP
jgi:type IV pilus assembly protein PilO